MHKIPKYQKRQKYINAIYKIPKNRISRNTKKPKYQKCQECKNTTIPKYNNNTQIQKQKQIPEIPKYITKTKYNKIPYTKYQPTKKHKIPKTHITK